MASKYKHPQCTSGCPGYNSILMAARKKTGTQHSTDVDTDSGSIRKESFLGEDSVQSKSSSPFQMINIYIYIYYLFLQTQLLVILMHLP